MCLEAQAKLRFYSITSSSLTGDEARWRSGLPLHAITRTVPEARSRGLLTRISSRRQASQIGIEPDP